METGTMILESMLSELDEMGLSTMAQTLSRLYHAPSFLETDRLSLFREVIDAEYQSKSGKKFANRLKKQTCQAVLPTLKAVWTQETGNTSRKGLRCLFPAWTLLRGASISVFWVLPTVENPIWPKPWRFRPVTTTELLTSIAMHLRRKWLQ